MFKTPERSDRAFTLIELSIAIIIIGLLVGGVVAGQSMLRAAKLRGAITDMSAHKNALAGFKDKYQYLPGDMPTATAIWGVATGGAGDGVDVTCASTTVPSTDAATCNGNGSGYIADMTNPASTDAWYESTRAWQQLAAAGFTGGSYNGVSMSGRGIFNAMPKVNVPDAKLGGKSAWSLRGFNYEFTGASEWFDQTAGNFLVLGATNGIAGGNAFNGATPILKPEEAVNIDSKMDDGKPGTGVVTSYKGTGAVNTGCTVDGSSNTEYSLTTTTQVCSLNFKLGL